MVRADSQEPECPSLPSWKSERLPGFSVSRVKGNGLLEPEWRFFPNLSGTAGMFYSSQESSFLEAFFYFRKDYGYG